MAPLLKGIGNVTNKKFRAVFDTNVFISATLSKNPSSPTKELIARWQKGEFILLICGALADELIEKLLESGVETEDIIEQLTALLELAEWVEVTSESIESVLPDPDDDVVLACALLGNADYLVTYDPHFDSLNGEYRGVKIVKALPFLWAVRGDTSPEVESK